METLVEVMEFNTWRYIALLAFYILTAFIAFNRGFVHGAINMYYFCKDKWGIEDDEEEEEDNAT